MYLSVARKIASQLPLIKISALQCGCIADASAPLHRCLHTCLCWNDWCWDLQLPLHFVCQHISCQLPGPLRRTDDPAEGSAVRQPSVVSAGCCFLWVFIYSWGWFSGIPSGIQFPRAGGFSCLDSIIFTFGSVGSWLVATEKMNQAFHKCSRSDSCTIPALYPPFLEGGIHNPSISRSFLTSKDDDELQILPSSSHSHPQHHSHRWSLVRGAKKKRGKNVGKGIPPPEGAGMIWCPIAYNNIVT